MGIRLQSIRVKGFRGIKNTEFDFEPTTVLVGTNNAGKTTLLKALQIAFTNTHLISKDDFYFERGYIDDTIIIDILFLPTDDSNKVTNVFDEEWSDVFKVDRIAITDDGSEMLAFRTIIKEQSKIFKKKQYHIDRWNPFVDRDENWYDHNYDQELNYSFEEIPFYYLDANRDILEDIRSKSSYLGRILASLEFSPEDRARIEQLLHQLNITTVESSGTLSELQTTLAELDTALDNSEHAVELTPFTKQIRDLNKGIKINYSAFSMDYHGMGTRSWSSLLVLKAFLKLTTGIFEKDQRPFYPIVAIEEPESHLHPNAQKKLYKQIKEIVGQKIISTHSNFIAANADPFEIRSIYKNRKPVEINIGQIKKEDFDSEELRQVQRQVFNARGELFFSKLVILFEGETEEQALPILVERYFSLDHVSLGVNFIGVGGYTKYLPFIRFCESFNIDYLIFSDNDQGVKLDVLKQIKKSRKNDANKVVFLNPGNDFEKELCMGGYIDEVKGAFRQLELDKCSGEQHRLKKEKEIETEMAGLVDTDYYEKMLDKKTQFAPYVAQELLKSEKPLPPMIIELFHKIEEIINLKNDD